MKKANSEPRPEKVETVAAIAKRLSGAKSAVITGNAGLTVGETTELRAKLFKEQVEYHVVKNTLAVLALRKVKMDGLEDWFKGPTAIAMAMGDAIAPTRILAQFSKDHEKLSIKGGWMDGHKVSAQDVKALSSLPGRPVLLSKLLAGLQSPMRGAVQVLAGPLRKLVYAMSAVRDAKTKAA